MATRANRDVNSYRDEWLTMARERRILRDKGSPSLAYMRNVYIPCAIRINLPKGLHVPLGFGEICRFLGFLEGCPSYPLFTTTAAPFYLGTVRHHHHPL